MQKLYTDIQPNTKIEFEKDILYYLLVFHQEKSARYIDQQIATVTTVEKFLVIQNSIPSCKYTICLYPYIYVHNLETVQKPACKLRARAKFNSKFPR